MKKVMRTALLAGVALTTLSLPSYAKDLGEGYFAKERFQIRLRGIGVFADGDGIVDGTSLGTDVGHAVTPEVDLTYFFTENIAAELIAATAQHSLDAGTLDLGETWILPPTLTLQYHFMPDEKFSPYIGAGINYSYFYGEDDGTGFNDLDVEGGFGLAAQAGFDYWINDNWGINFDAKYINLEVDVDVNLGATPLQANNVDLNPWIVGAGVSYRF
tara:strand:- start:8518 stop:9162 length:645 start_codon:yes stop_codon:yes gene_type:complete